MKNRIFPIMDMNRKKVGAVVLCGALILALGTGAAFAANTEAKLLRTGTKAPTMLTPQAPIAMISNPDVYAPYAAFEITISENGAKLLYKYKRQSVRLFVDEKSNVEAFYLDGAGDLNLSVVRNASGEITGVKEISEQKAQEYQSATKHYEQNISDGLQTVFPFDS